MIYAIRATGRGIRYFEEDELDKLSLTFKRSVLLVIATNNQKNWVAHRDILNTISKMYDLMIDARSEKARELKDYCIKFEDMHNDFIWLETNGFIEIARYVAPDNKTFMLEKPRGVLFRASK